MTEYKRQEMYAERNQLVSKSYKLRKKVVAEFAVACKAAGVSQSAQLTKMMKEFIELEKK
jgi:hypothetical protein